MPDDAPVMTITWSDSFLSLLVIGDPSMFERRSLLCATTLPVNFAGLLGDESEELYVSDTGG